MATFLLLKIFNICYSTNLNPFESMSHLNYCIAFPLFLCLEVFVCLFFCPGDGTQGFLHTRWACYFGDTLTGPFVVLHKAILKGRSDESFFFFFNFHPHTSIATGNWRVPVSRTLYWFRTRVLRTIGSFLDVFHMVGVAFLRRKRARASWMCFFENQDKKIPLHLSGHPRWGVHLLFSFRGQLSRWSQ